MSICWPFPIHGEWPTLPDTSCPLAEPYGGPLRANYSSFKGKRRRTAANNYLQFSEVIPHLTPDEETWLQQQLAVISVFGDQEYLEDDLPDGLNPDDADWSGVRAWRNLETRSFSDTYSRLCEWMSDGSLRLRFLNREGQILGQQVVAEEGLGPLQTLVGFAFVARCCSPEVLLEACERMGLVLDAELVEALVEAVRVRATLASDGGVDLEAVEGEEP